MIVLFYFFWTLAVLRILSAPLLRIGLKSASGLMILVGGWVLLGLIVYHVQASNFARQQERFEGETRIQSTQILKLENLLRSHPTSRDLLLLQAQTAYQNEDLESFQDNLRALEYVDPNNPSIQSLRLLRDREKNSN